MNDGLNELLRQRFASHEAPVPDDAWSRISDRVAAHADGSSLRETLQKKFEGHFVEPHPGTWAHIASRLGRAGSAGNSGTYGWIAAGVAAVAITAVSLWYAQRPPATTAHTGTMVVQPAEPVITPPSAEVVPDMAPTPIAAQAVAAPLPANSPEQRKRALPAATEEVGVEPDRRSEPDNEAIASTSAPQEEHEEHQELQAPDPVSTSDAWTAPETTPEHAPAQVSKPAVNVEPTKDPVTGSDTENEPAAPEPRYTLYIPTAFSVNSDGVNDKLRIVATDYEEVDVRIATINGALVFRSNDLARMWDGRLPNGSMAEEGLYRCLVSLTDLQGAVHYKTEVVRLLR